ncbi:hypothetical protein C1H46_000689 [Malus baccata]|uniref:Uncharacterized protein n=1 Tax=Malus baccata TaxID=106549 RepID=A0A540NRM7_MALBA|nr:hypothetical protein C1H46_000689 [Malus baccata]
MGEEVGAPVGSGAEEEGGGGSGMHVMSSQRRFRRMSLSSKLGGDCLLGNPLIVFVSLQRSELFYMSVKYKFLP